MKIIIFSHIADCDGIVPIVLAKLAFEQVDYCLSEAGKMDETFSQVNCLDDYDLIFITDMCILEQLYLSLNENIKNKLHIFDHHKTALEMNKYPLINIEIENECGTSLFYKYLLKNYNNKNIGKKATNQIVELTRLLDTWQWTTDNVVEARWLGEYLNTFGNEKFIEHFYNYILNNEEFSFSSEEKYLFEVEDIKANNYVLEKEKEIISVEIDGYKTGIVFAESNRSLLGNVLSIKYKDVYDFITIINISRGISYRSIEQDVTTFATKYNGGGHKHAAGSPIKEEVKEKIIKEIYNEAVIK